MLIATAADSKQGFYPDLERRVKKEGIDLLFEPLPTFSWAAMVEWELSVARRFPKRTIVFVDAWDFLMQGTRAELERVTSEQDVLFHSDAHCWPEPHKADYYPDYGSSSPYRYVNGTGPAGRGECIAELIETGLRHWPIRGRESSIFADNDQRFWTDIYLECQAGFHLAIDYGCRLSVQLNSVPPGGVEFIAGRVLLYPLGTMPIFVHANGASRSLYAKEMEVLRCG